MQFGAWLFIYIYIYNLQVVPALHWNKTAVDIIGKV